MPENIAPVTVSKKWVVVLISIAIFVFISLFLVFNINIFKDIWLWLIGLLGPIIAFFKGFGKGISKVLDFNDDENREALLKENSNYKNTIGNLKSKIGKLEAQVRATNTPTDNFDGLTITVLRYFDDGETTLGLMFLESKFFCYTLEDTFSLNSCIIQAR